MTPRSSPDRRRFLQTSAAAALGLAAGRLTAADEKDDPFGGFIVGVQSYTFRKFNLEQALKRTKGLGLQNAEFYSAHVSPKATPDELNAVLKLCKEYDVTPRAFGVSEFTKDHDANKKLFEFGKALGVKMLSANPSVDAFDSLDKLCDEYKIAIGIHPHGPMGKGRDKWWSAEIIMKAVKDHHALIGTCLDTGHLIRMAQLGEKLDPAEQVRVMKDRNFGMHLKDNDNATDTNVVFGKGVLDVPAVLKALRDVKFNGMISIEYEAKEEEPTEDVKACLQVFKESVKKLA
jgi:inosose dehydratase